MSQASPVGRVGLVDTAVYLPRRWATAAELGKASGIPAEVIETKFGLRGKHIAAADEHVSDMAARAGERLLAGTGVAPASVDAVVYFGSTWKDHPVWQAAPRVAHLLGCDRAFALELDYVSCGSPVALRVVRDMLAAEPDLRTVLMVAASRESALIDPGNARSRFMLNFGDGAVAALLTRGGDGDEVLGSHGVTDGSLSLHARVPAGGSVEPASAETVRADRHRMDVADPSAMKERLDAVSLPTFVSVAEEAAKRSGASLADVAYLCGIHVKRSMHDELVAALGLPPERACYLDDTGHMSGADPLVAYHRARSSGTLVEGDLCLLLAAGTGYTWAATCVRVGSR